MAAALACARQGLDVLVLEKSDRLGEIGAGIQLGPNAFHCFDALGIAGPASQGAVFIDTMRLMDATTADEITSVRIDSAFRTRMGNPYAVVHRADLHSALVAAAQATSRVEIRTAHAVQGFEQDGSSVRVFCEGRDPVEGSALIGADGLHSVVRAEVIGDGAPRVSGHSTYRSVIPTSHMPEALRWNAATLWAGPKCHIVHYPLKGGDVFNLVVTYHRDATEAVAGRPVDRSEVRQGFEHIAALPRQIIEHGQDWKLWVLCDRDPVGNWTQGRVTLLGDAAHPMLQYFAQGACTAMEDGVCLGEMLTSHDAVEDALAAYQDARLARTARVQMNARLIGDHIYHPAGAEALVRNQVMGAMSQEDWHERLAWLYAGRGN